MAAIPAASRPARTCTITRWCIPAQSVAQAYASVENNACATGSGENQGTQTWYKKDVNLNLGKDSSSGKDHREGRGEGRH